MPVLSDKWIKKIAKTKGMIKPFVSKQIRKGKISFGLSSYGYDARVSNEFKIFTNVNSGIVDPKVFKKESFVTKRGKECIIPPNSFALARTIEYFKIPENILVICLGKSTYARCGIIVNVTPLEPGWEGHVTLEFSNTTPLPAKIYANEGVAQFVFLKGNEKPDITYAKRKGKYMKQKGVTLPKGLISLMQKLLIKGNQSLSGTIPISGSKNATLPILAASILANNVKLTNVPLVQDIFTMIELLKFIGIKVKMNTQKKIIELNNDKSKVNTLAPYKLVKTMRAGVLVLGSLLTKYKKAKVSLPGGCSIGTRPVDLHLFALKKLGANIKIKDGYIIAEAKKGLNGSKIKFPSISVGATENALLAAYGAKGKTVLNNCAIEPEILDLISFLKKLGSEIKVNGRKIVIKGKSQIKKNISHKIIFDRIEAITYLIAGALVGKKITINKIEPKVFKRETDLLKKWE